jgi:phosphoglycolate phosphatase-like HAD superfamily hydrolase
MASAEWSSDIAKGGTVTHVADHIAPADKAVAGLTTFQPTGDHFIGIDSDGCVFDAMEIKHKECFIPATIQCWGLQAVSSLVRETAEFVNLYSDGRGLNRWLALLRVFALLAERPEVTQRGVHVPAGNSLRRFVASGFPLSGAGLRDYSALHRQPDPELETALVWTDEVDERIADMVHDVPPFLGVRESLAAASAAADLMVVSATPLEALSREWAEHDLVRYMDLIAGQEAGTKERHLELAAKGRYADDHILLIGDAPADRDTAAAAGVLFYPINPGSEVESWRRFRVEALDRFLTGRYAGTYQDALLADFTALLPTTPPWRI